MSIEQKSTEYSRFNSDIDTQLKRVLSSLENVFSKVPEEMKKDILNVTKEIYLRQNPNKIIVQKNTTQQVLSGIKDSSLKTFILENKEDIIKMASGQWQESFTFDKPAGEKLTPEDEANLWVKI